MKKNKVIILLTALIICSSTIPILAKESLKNSTIKKQSSKVELTLKNGQEKNTIVKKYDNSKKDYKKKNIKKKCDDVKSLEASPSNNITKIKPMVKYSEDKKLTTSIKTKKNNTSTPTKHKKVIKAKTSSKKIVKNNYYNYNFLISMCNDANKLLLDINKNSIAADCKVVAVKDEKGDSWDYGKIKAPYDTIKNLEYKLSEYFTKNYITNLKNSRFYKSIDNEPYFLIGQAGLKSHYTYTSIISVNSTKNTIKATCKTEIPSWNKYKGEVTLKLEDGKWKIDSFDSILN